MIERTDLNNLRVMDFFQTLTNIAAHLNNEDLAVLKLENVVNNIFTPALTAMDEALKPFRKTGLTDPLLTHDAERDAAIVGLSAHVRAGQPAAGFGYQPGTRRPYRHHSHPVGIGVADGKHSFRKPV